MNFTLSEEQLAFQKTAKQFSEQELAPFAAEWDSKGYFPIDTIRKAGKLGFLGIYSPEEQGGLGLKRLDAALIFAQLARGCTSTAAYLTIHNMTLWMLCTFGQETVKKTWCEAMASGEKLGSYCLTEPSSGSDAGSLRTKAELRGDQYFLTGSKVFISGAGETDLLIVMARTGGEGPGGISSFLVPADSKGISYGRKEEKMGWNSQPTRMVNFDHVAVAKAQRLGEENGGFAIAMKGLDGGRINIASCSLGAAAAALELAGNYLHERKQFRRPLADFQALQFRFADMATHLKASELMVWHAADQLDKKKKEATLYCAMAKRLATDLCFDICNQALQIYGGYGYIREYPLERFVRDSRVHQILEGTNEIMRLIISRQLLAQAAK